MLSSIEITDFKCFRSLKLSFGALTLLTGFNSAGKSTALQPLLLLAQSLRSSSFPTKKFPLNGALVRLGSVSDVLPSNSSDPKLTFKVATISESRIWELNARAGERALRFEGTGAIAFGQEDDEVESISVIRCLSQLQYLSATREGTPDDYPVPDSESRAYRNVGPDGKFAPFEYEKLADDEVSLRRRHPEEAASSLRKQVDAWMSHIFPGAQVNVQHFSQLGLLGLQFRNSDFGDWRRPANVGYGFSYAFPMVVALLTARDGQTIVVDSPEAHLHPSAQSAVGRMLAHFAAAGVQVIAETHSDHVLNGVRLSVKSRAIHASEVVFHFFSGPSAEAHGVLSPSIDSNGVMHEWPDGFFDQSEKDLVQIAGWA
jgi:predicted ATPase